MEFQIPCNEVAQTATDGEVIRFRAKDPEKGAAYMTISIREEKLKGQFTPGKTYKVIITEA